MISEVVMPQMGADMVEGTIVAWRKHEGDAVERGEIIAEIETDKATMEVEAVDEGEIAEILVPEGAQGVKVNTPIATLRGEGAQPPSPPSRGRGQDEGPGHAGLPIL